jgi:hypothetical protein
MAVGHLLYPTTITAALTGATPGGTIKFPKVPKNLCIQYNFDYGSGGTSGDFHIETSLDGGTTWIEIALMVVTTADLREVFNLSSLTPLTTMYDAGTALSDDTAKDGILGNQFRANITTIGTYAATTLTINFSATM